MVSSVAVTTCPQTMKFVALRDYPGLIGPAARIMTESSPMYAWVDDIVPVQQYVPALVESMCTVLQRCAGAGQNPRWEAISWMYTTISSL